MNHKLMHCSMLGTGVMVAGLYCFLWGKTKEMKKSAHLPRATAAALAIEAATATSEPAPLPSAAVVPTASPTPNNNTPIAASDAEQGCNRTNP